MKIAGPAPAFALYAPSGKSYPSPAVFSTSSLPESNPGRLFVSSVQLRIQKASPMQPEPIFSLLNLLALVGWLLLIVLPRWRWTGRIVQSGAVSLVFAATYLVLIGLSLPGSGGSFSTLAGVRRLFENDYALLAGWAHYLAFDLFVGSWVLGNAQKFKIPHLLVIPCLFLTFMLGPVGLLTYYVLRAVLRKTILNGVAYENA
jgi:hypothetical protein